MGESKMRNTFYRQTFTSVTPATKFPAIYLLSSRNGKQKKELFQLCKRIKM